MKFKMSKSQWEHIGKVAGWDSDPSIESEESLEEFRKGRSQAPIADEIREEFDSHKVKNMPVKNQVTKRCQQCNGDKRVSERGSIITCPFCSGKGYTNQEDHDWYIHRSSMGSKCPCENVYEDPSLKMRGIKVTFENGDEVITSINGTMKEISEYYFQMAYPGTNKAMKIEFLPYKEEN